MMKKKYEPNAQQKGFKSVLDIDTRFMDSNKSRQHKKKIGLIVQPTRSDMTDNSLKNQVNRMVKINKKKTK